MCVIVAYIPNIWQFTNINWIAFRAGSFYHPIKHLSSLSVDTKCKMAQQKAQMDCFYREKDISVCFWYNFFSLYVNVCHLWFTTFDNNSSCRWMIASCLQKQHIFSKFFVQSDSCKWIRMDKQPFLQRNKRKSFFFISHTWPTLHTR